MKFLKSILKHSENIDFAQEGLRYEHFPVDIMSYEKYNILYRRYESSNGKNGKTKTTKYKKESCKMAKMGRPKLPNTKKKVVSIRISDQLYAQLLAYAEKHNMTTTDVVLRGVETFISRQE